MLRPTLFFWPLLFLACDVANPAPASESQDAFSDDLGKADAFDEVTLHTRLDESGTLSLREAGSELPGAPTPLSNFACAAAFRRHDTTRVECVRGQSSLELLWDPDARNGRMIFRPTGRATDLRSYARCEATDSQTPWPEEIHCTATRPKRSRGLVSPVPSTVASLAIPNAHQVGSDDTLFRSMAPRSDEDYQSLIQTGINAVLVFKKPTANGHDVSDELATLTELGFADDAVRHIPFAWKDFPDFATPCRETLEGLRFLRDQRRLGRKTLFHCTVGEDRTGYLAGLVRLLAGETDAETIFQDELCEHGYGTGNPFKPRMVTAKVEEGLTPLYRKMAYKIKTGTLTPTLEDTACDVDPDDDPAFASPPGAESAFTCGTFTAFDF